MDATFQLEKTSAAAPAWLANRSLRKSWPALHPHLAACAPQRNSVPPPRAASNAKRRKNEQNENLIGTLGKIESLVSHRKQTTAVLSTRDKFRGSFAAEPRINSAKKRLPHLRFSLPKSPKINRQLFHVPPSKFFARHGSQATDHKSRVTASPNIACLAHANPSINLSGKTFSTRERTGDAR
jgi:hypothetical protein